MQVVALELGFYAGTRRKTGDVFNIDETKLKQKDGKPVLPKWVEVVVDVRQAKQKSEAVKAAEHAKQKAGVIASSGGAAARSKVDATAEQLAG